MLNTQQIEGHWMELKGQIKERWGAMTDNDLDRAEGDVDRLVGIIQQKTGEARNQIEDFLEEASVQYRTTAERTKAAARDYAAKASESVRETYDGMSHRVREGYAEAEGMVKRRPAESVAVAFGTGLIAGVIVGLVLRPRS